MRVLQLLSVCESIYLTSVETVVATRGEPLLNCICTVSLLPINANQMGENDLCAAWILSPGDWWCSQSPAYWMPCHLRASDLIYFAPRTTPYSANLHHAHGKNDKIEDEEKHVESIANVDLSTIPQNWRNRNYRAQQQQKCTKKKNYKSRIFFFFHSFLHKRNE